MSAARAERLVNLVLCLLSSRPYLPAERIRRIVPGYAETRSDEAFFRMFERDKAELRELGVPLETGRIPGLDAGEGYRIARRDYELPDIDLEPDEAAAVALAARLWDSSQLAGAAHGAVRKLRAAGVEVDTAGAVAVEPRVRASEPALPSLISAVQAGQIVTFQHRKQLAAEPVARTLEPWGVVSWRGRWYVVGHDQDREATRCFRVSRIIGTVRAVGAPGAVRRPDGLDLLKIVAGSAEPPPVAHTARLWLAQGRAHGLRRHATVLGEMTVDGVDGHLVAVPVPGHDVAARWIAGHGPDVVVVEPAELAEAVRARLLAATGERGLMAEGVAERLPRLLALVPYLLARPGVPIEEVAADFDVTVRQLRRDLELLWMCGLPGYGPGDLIDLSFEGDTVTVTFDAGMRRPLRLSGAEATALVVALRALAETPGVVDAGAVRRALAKIEAASGQADGVVVGLATREEAALAAVRDALDRRRALRIRYYTASRDAVGERTVDPMRLLLLEGRSYLEAWCRGAEGMRLFRLDRIEHVATLDEPAVPPPHARPTDVSAGLFRAHPDQQVAVLTLAPDARWVAEYYPVEELIEGEGGAATVRMRYGDTGWMVRLVLGLGADVAVREPPGLATAVAQRARAAVHRSSHLPAGRQG